MFSDTPSPAFGKADLTNCEREQIHLAASIQPHGALLVVREGDMVVVQHSANAAEFLGLEGSLAGIRLCSISGNLHDIVANYVDAYPIAVRCAIGDAKIELDCLVHRPPSGGIVVELERAGPPVELTSHVDKAVQTVLAAPSLRRLCDETVKFFKSLTNYDRVMLYRFNSEGHGQVLSEEREGHLESYLGNWYPASDIPQIARRLYERNRVRVLVDAGYAPVPLDPRFNPTTANDLDMSMCFLRSMSPLHIQYLRNMGVSATLVVSLLVGGKLWGLIACHHYGPKQVQFEVRAVCELLGEVVATRITALEGFVQAHAEVAARRLEQGLIESIAQHGDWRVALFDRGQTILQPVAASGAALVFEDQVLTSGEVPDTVQLQQIADWLDARERTTVTATASLATDIPHLTGIEPGISGLLAVPLSATRGEYLLWFRRERVRTVTWGGDPHKPVLVGDDPSELSPRRSFAQWHELVEGTAEPWTVSDISIARLIGETLADVILQFRSVRMLIAKDQLDQVSGRVGGSKQPVIVADAAGTIVFTNEAFDIQRIRLEPQGIADLARACDDPSQVALRLSELLTHRRPWRGEVQFATETGERPFLLRADAVMSAPGKTLGFIVVLTDLTERKSVEAARRALQKSIVEGGTRKSTRRGSSLDLRYETLLATIVENAQVAALEVADGVDPADVPAMLESVRNSMNRSSEILERLDRHATASLREP